MIAAYFLYCGLVDTAQDALDLFAFQRSKSGTGVSNPSQIRYVRYFASIMVSALLQVLSWPAAASGANVDGWLD